MHYKPLTALSFALFMFFGCSGGNDPGPLTGTWKMTDPIPMTIQFRPGETESMGMIDKVSYDVRGNDVIVTAKEGMTKGTAFRFTIVGSDTMKTEYGVYHRVK